MRAPDQRTALVTGRRSAAVGLAGLLVLTSLHLPSIASAEPPPAMAAATFLAAERGGSPDDWELVYERPARVAGSDERLWVGKLIDRHSGQIEIVYRAPGGTVGGPQLLAAREQAAAVGLSAVELKASAALRSAAAGGDRALPVAVWLAADTAAAERAMADKHPEIEWAGGRPIVSDLDLGRRLRAELWEARRQVYAAAAGGLRPAVEAAGGRVAYASTSAPLIFVDLPAAGVAALAERPDVVTMGLEGGWAPAMATAGKAVEANWTDGSGDRGNGVRVGVVEYHNVRRSGDLAGKVAKSYSTTGTLRYTGSGQFDHPTWVAGAVASQHSRYRGVAPGAVIVSAGTGGYSPSLTYDRRIIAAADWAVAPGGGDADIVNTSLVQDTATGADEARRYFDSIVDADGRLAVSAAGNYVNLLSWDIGSPGTGWNVLTVGGVDDRSTAGRGDDRLWYVPGSNGSNWHDRPGAPWNQHGDFNKPNLVAPAVGVRTANGLSATGTSVATPIAAGVAAQVIAGQPVLANWPEGTRAILMAGAVHRVPMPNGSRNVDHEGVGMTSARWSHRIAHTGDNTYGGYRIGALSAGQQLTQQISVQAGDRLRVALAWDSHTSGSRNRDKRDGLRADLDLRVTLPGGSVAGSYTLDNAYEWVEITAPSSGIASIEVLQARFDGTSERFGLAWAKIGDRRAPHASVLVPRRGEPWAVPSARVKVRFNEPVRNVNGQTFQLRDVSSAKRVSSSVTYASRSRTATLTPGRSLRPGQYRARLRSGITDRAGNALAARRWTFNVAKPSPPVSVRFSPARRIRFSAGSHAGYRFDDTGAVIARKKATLGSAASARAARRMTVDGRPGVWLRVTSGRWAGYWVRESSRAGLAGATGVTRLASARPMRLAAGRHAGYRFSSNGSRTVRRIVSLDRSTRVNVLARAVINGAWHLEVAEGALAGYWVPESSAAYLPRGRNLADLRAARDTRISIRRGTYTGRRYDAHGRVVARRTATLASSDTLPVLAWAIVNGRPMFYVSGGAWAGFWLSASNRVRMR